MKFLKFNVSKILPPVSLLLTSIQHHISPVLRDLHWLPVKFCIYDKILLLTYKAIHGLSPLYISELIQMYSPARSLRSANQMLLSSSSQPTTKFYGSRIFYSSAPQLWNNLPLNIRQANSLISFKSLLKSHLFQIAYPV